MGSLGGGVRKASLEMAKETKEGPKGVCEEEKAL